MKRMVTIDAGACFLIALLALTLPLNWLLAAASAAAFHELCHFAAILLTGGQVYGICVGAGGISMEVSPMEYSQELICALAGPVGSFLLLAFIPVFPRLGICAGVQGIFNLLPVYPLDGGRALQSVCHMVSSESASRRVCAAARILTVLALCSLICILTFRFSLGVSPVFLGGFLLYKVFRGKTPCKESNLAVQ